MGTGEQTSPVPNDRRGTVRHATVFHRKRPATPSQRLEGRRILGRADSATCRPFNPLPYPAVAFPLNLCHLACDNVDFEGPKAADAGFPSLQRDFVVTGR